MTDKHPLNEQLSKALNIRLTGWNPAGNTDDALMAAREGKCRIQLETRADWTFYAFAQRQVESGSFAHASATSPDAAEAIAQAVLAAVGGAAFERAAGGVGK
jgi:hypothetical protein